MLNPRARDPIPGDARLPSRSAGLPFDVCAIDLDGSLPPQGQLWDGPSTGPVDLRAWGPRLRLACRLRAFKAFERDLSARLAGGGAGPRVVLLGSGDFHHVTLALLHQLTGPFNLLVLDKHPDWVRGVPFLHCGTWLARALRLTHLRRVFHVGGDLDFDNHFGPFAPWADLQSGRIRVIPARRRFRGARWKRVQHDPLLADPAELLGDRLCRLIDTDRNDLTSAPLYVTVDKDVLTADEAVVNWDSGWLDLAAVLTVVDVFGRAAGGRFAGADLVGDWSPVRTVGWPRRVLDLWEHPALNVQPAEAATRNGRANRVLITHLSSLAANVTRPPGALPFRPETETAR